PSPSRKPRPARGRPPKTTTRARGTASRLPAPDTAQLAPEPYSCRLARPLLLPGLANNQSTAPPTACSQTHPKQFHPSLQSCVAAALAAGPPPSAPCSGGPPTAS